MRVLQCIDSLVPGGAERMAVNLANNLVTKVQYSGLCVTRKEGLLSKDISEEVDYFFLNKKSVYDLKAIKKLFQFIRSNKITIFHAHGTSFFMGTIQKILSPTIKLIWHDHYGNRIHKKKISFPELYFCSFRFDGVISVSSELHKWNEEKIQAKTYTYIPNFVDTKSNKSSSFIEPVNKNRINLICVANFREPKNHLNLLKSFKIVRGQMSDVDLYLIGKDYNDIYSSRLKKYITQNHIEQNVRLISGTSDVYSWLSKMDVGIISSDVEGLPMVLLEYGIAKLSVVSTDVGQCLQIIKDNGKVVRPNEPEALAEAILYYIKNEKGRKLDAERFNYTVLNEFSEDIIIEKVLKFYSSI